jgi:hypothetical protein
VKHVGALALVGVMFLPLAGCGSAKPPALSVSCVTRNLPSGLLRATLTITNTTPAAQRALIYGPALRWIRHVYPVLVPHEVAVIQGGHRASYVGLIVPRVGANGNRKILLRLAGTAHRLPIAVSGTGVVQAGDTHPLQDSPCQIG